MTSVDLGHLIIFLELLLSFYIPTLLSWVLVFHCHCPRTRHDIKLFDLYDTILITGADQMWGTSGDNRNSHSLHVLQAPFVTFDV